MISFNARKNIKELVFRLKRIDGGLCTKYAETQIKDNQSPYTKNVSCAAKGSLSKRWGQSKIYNMSLGDGPINGQYFYRNPDGSANKLIHHGTKLYTQSLSNQPVEIYSELADNESIFFMFGSKGYIFDGTNYVQTDSTALGTAPVIGYIPLFTLGRDPSGSGTVNEQLNYLSNSWKDSFSVPPGTSADLIRMTAHGIETGDLIVNTTRSSEARTVTRQDDNLLVVSPILNQVPGDIIKKYKKQDGSVAGAGTDETTLIIPGHGLTTGDYVINITRGVIARLVTFVDVNTISVPSVAAQSAGDIIEKYKYIADDTAEGTPKVYLLSFAPLTSANDVKVWIEGIEKTLTTDFTVNSTTGEITLVANPPTGTNNIVIQGKKTGLMDPTKITKCLKYAIFGGGQDTRIFLTRNPESPASIYWSGLLDPTYWPEENYAVVGSASDYCTNFAVAYDQLILLKELSLWRISYELTSSGESQFPILPLNNSLGCDMPDSVQVIDNMVVFANSYSGVFGLVRTDVREEKNIRPLSGNINMGRTMTGLLDESISNLKKARSFDFLGKYGLCVGSKVWVWDYWLSPYADMGTPTDSEERQTWFFWDNINANSFAVFENDLYYGDRDAGIIQKFVSGMNDNGVAIDAIWRSKAFDFNLPEWLKTIQKVWWDTKQAYKAVANIRYLTDKGYSTDSEIINSNAFSWANFHWDTFTWSVNKFPTTIMKKPRIRNVTYFQLEINNKTVNQDCSIMNIGIKYCLDKEKR